jgi:sodium-dependent dicarboxylate transporter 2/3/5
MSQSKPVNLTKHYINVAIIFFFFFGFGMIPAPGQITQVGMQVLGVFLGMIWGWMFADMLWPSLLGLIVLGMSGYAEKGFLPVLQGAASNKNVILVFFFLVFSAYMEASGLSKAIAIKMLTMKCVQGRPWILIFMILLASYVLGIFIMVYAVVFLLWTIVYDICDIAGYSKREKLPAFLVVGIVHCSGVAGLCLPFQMIPNLCLSSLDTATGLTVATGPFVLYNLIITSLGSFAYFLIGRFLLKIDVNRLASLTSEDIAKGHEVHFGRDEKIALAILIGFLVCILVPGFLPAQNPIHVWYTRISDQGILALSLCIAGLLMFKDGKIAKVPELIKKGVNWNLIFLLMATFTVGDALQSDKTGVVAQITASLTPIFNGMNAIVFIVVTVIALWLITQFVHNIVLAVVFIPLLCGLAASTGMGDSVAIIVMFGILHAITQALCTPAASNRGALIFGNEWAGEKYAFRYGCAAAIGAEVVIIAIGIPLGFLMF